MGRFSFTLHTQADKTSNDAQGVFAWGKSDEWISVLRLLTWYPAAQTGILGSYLLSSPWHHLNLSASFFEVKDPERGKHCIHKLSSANTAAGFVPCPAGHTIKQSDDPQSPSPHHLNKAALPLF